MEVSKDNKIKIDYKKCKPEKCGVCFSMKVCPAKIWKQDPGDYPYLVRGFCKECGDCIEACPEGAVSFLEG